MKYSELQQECVSRTIKYLQSANLLDEAVITLLEKAIEQGAGYYQDPLGALYSKQKLDTPIGELDKFFFSITDSLAQAQFPKPAMLTFGHRFPLPTKLYSKFPELYEICKNMQVPVVYSDQEEALGLGSLNPVAMELVIEKMNLYFAEKQGSKPYAFRFLLNASSWSRLVERQFEHD